MFLNLSFSLCGILYVIIVLCIYFWKKKTDSDRNLAPFFFKFLLIFTTFLFFLEVLCIIFMMNPSAHPVLTEFFCRLHILGDIVWVTIFLIYIWCSTKKPVDEIQRKKQRRNVAYVLLIVDFVIYFITCNLNITYSPAVNSNIKLVGGYAMYPFYFISSFMILVLLFTMFKARNKVNKSFKWPLYYFMFVYVFLDVIQLIYFSTNVTYILFMFCFGVVGLFFTFESQDTKLLTEVEESMKDAELANKAKTEFLANVSHEIRTPMNTILGFSEALLEEPVLTEELVKKDASNIKDASNYLLELINNILDISRIESGKTVLEEKEYKLKDLLFEVNSVISSKVNNNILNFHIRVDENTPSVLFGDSSKIYLALIRILENSIEHTKFGSVSLEVSGAHNDDKYRLSLLVSNTGHEMQEEDFDKEFSDFAEIGNGNDTINSTKLGLIVAKNLIKILGGTIDFKNEKGKGTRYIINIDQIVVDETKIGDVYISSGDERKKEVLNFEGKNLLLVDDNKLNLNLATRLLEKYNFTITGVDNGKDCVELVKNNTYDMIFLDHMMPDLDGIATVHILRDSGCTSPIIALTANSYTGLKEMYIKEGFNDYLAKPINQKELYKLLKDYFDK